MKHPTKDKERCRKCGAKPAYHAYIQWCGLDTKGHNSENALSLCRKCFAKVERAAGL